MSSGAGRMVADQLRPHGIHDERVLAVMAALPREEFIPIEVRDLAYEDSALAIGFGQTISQPLVVATVCQALKIGAGESILEVGSGSGYLLALLARLGRTAIGLERHAVLAARAAATLTRLGVSNAVVHQADGHGGWPPAAPYDRIAVSAAAVRVPPALLDQLADGGLMVIPVGPPDGHQELILIQRTGDRIETHPIFPVRFVPLVEG